MISKTVSKINFLQSLVFDSSTMKHLFVNHALIDAPLKLKSLLEDGKFLESFFASFHNQHCIIRMRQVVSE